MSKQTIYEIIKIVCTAILSIAATIFATSCASTTRIVTKQGSTGKQTNKISVTQETEQVITVSPRDSLVIFKKAK